ncbi:MAG TPA: hypothetical protein VG942_12850 [Hyphomonadaceae bacterium]|nr:hypothetical protein [Hyphomonadaceae bacterium]
MKRRSWTKYLALSGLLAISAGGLPASAEPANAGTLREVLAHGVVMSVSGADIDVVFTADGKFTALGSTGTWRIDGEKLCSKSDITLIETCAVYPAGKKSGDAFNIDAPGAVVAIRIK